MLKREKIILLWSIKQNCGLQLVLFIQKLSIFGDKKYSMIENGLNKLL